MQLTQEQITHFHRLWLPLLDFTNILINDNYHSFKNSLGKSDYVLGAALRDHLWENSWVLDEFIKENPYNLTNEDLKIVKSWRQFRFGNFTLCKVVRGLGIFATHDEPYDFYSVYPLSSSFTDIFPEIPVMVRTSILPYENVFITDGLFSIYAIRFGPGMRKSINDGYIDAYERHVIRTSVFPDYPLTSKEKIAQINQTNQSVLRYFKHYLKGEGHSEKIINRDIQTARNFAEFLLRDEKQAVSLRDLTMESFDRYLLTNDSDLQRSMVIGLRRLVEYLRDTERMDWALAEDSLDKLNYL